MVASTSLYACDAQTQTQCPTDSPSPSVRVERPKPEFRLQKLTKVAQEFEGILLSSWLEEAQKSSLDSSDASQDAGSETLRSLGTQAVAQALAQRGGLGIARMIVHHFAPTLSSICAAKRDI